MIFEKDQDPSKSYTSTLHYDFLKNNSKGQTSKELLYNLMMNFSDKVDSPIFVIRSYAQLLQKTSDQDVLKRGLSQLDLASIKLDKLIGSLYDLVNIYCLPNPVNDLVYFKEAFETMKIDLNTETEHAQVKFDVDFSQCKSLWFPPSFLKQIFNRVISNSLTHNAQQNDLAISISTTKMLSSTILEIKDNGSGIDSTVLNDGVSEPFCSYSKSESDLGIGLSIIQAIAHATESILEIESALGEGTTIRYYFRQ